MSNRRHRGRIDGEPVTYQLPSPADGVQLETFLPWTLVKRGVKTQVIMPSGSPQAFIRERDSEHAEGQVSADTPLLRALGLAHYWQRLLDEGRFNSITEIAQVEGLDRAYSTKIGRLALLAPDIVNGIAQGNGVVLERLIRQSAPCTWEAQRIQFGLPQ